MEGYYLTRFKTKMREYQGMFIKLRSGKTIELTEYNLDSLYEFNQYLIEKQIPYLGYKKTWFPLHRKVS